MMKTLFPALAAIALALPGVAHAQANHAAQTHTTQPQKKKTTTTTQTTRTVQTPARTTTVTRTTTTAKKTSHSFAKGSKFSRSKAPNYRRVQYTESKRLTAPPRGYTWVRAGDDALLVRLSNNIIARVVYNVF